MSCCSYLEKTIKSVQQEMDSECPKKYIFCQRNNDVHVMQQCNAKHLPSMFRFAFLILYVVEIRGTSEVSMIVIREPRLSKYIMTAS